MKQSTKKRRRYLNVNLIETSVVGIPAYPDAHYSFMKALSQINTQLNKEFIERRNENMSEENNATSPAILSKEEKALEVVKEQQVEISVEKTAEKAIEKTAEVAVSKEAELKSIVEDLSKKFEEIAKSISTQRGLVESQETKPSKVKSLGELAVESGFFSRKH